MGAPVLKCAWTCWFVDWEKYVQLKEDWDGEEDWVNDQTDETHRSTQDKSSHLKLDKNKNKNKNIIGDVIFCFITLALFIMYRYQLGWVKKEIKYIAWLYQFDYRNEMLTLNCCPIQIWQTWIFFLCRPEWSWNKMSIFSQALILHVLPWSHSKFQMGIRSHIYRRFLFHWPYKL